MHWEITALWGEKKVELRETQRAVTPFGGLVVFFEFLRRVRYREAVNKYLPFRPGLWQNLGPLLLWSFAAATVLSFFGRGKTRVLMVSWSVSMWLVFQLIFMFQFD